MAVELRFGTVVLICAAGLMLLQPSVSGFGLPAKRGGLLSSLGATYVDRPRFGKRSWLPEEDYGIFLKRGGASLFSDIDVDRPRFGKK